MNDHIDEQWKTYDDFAHGIDTYRRPNVNLAGTKIKFDLDANTFIEIDFLDDATAAWQSNGFLQNQSRVTDPYDAVAVRHDVIFLNLPFESRERESITIMYSIKTGRAVVVHSNIDKEKVDGVPQVTQKFWAATIAGQKPTGLIPEESRDLIGMRNVYRYSPSHLYEHVYISSKRYAWQCLEGVQRGHGDMDLSTVWKLDEGLYVFCFREFRISVASVWLHDLSYQFRTTGIFLGISETGQSMHSRAGGHIYPLGTVKYPDAQPI